MDLSGIDKMTGTPIERFAKLMATKCQNDLLEHHIPKALLGEIGDLRSSIGAAISIALQEWPNVKDKIQTKE